jgi:hypothetical protein
MMMLAGICGWLPSALERDREKCVAVFRKDHAQSRLKPRSGWQRDGNAAIAERIQVWYFSLGALNPALCGYFDRIAGSGIRRLEEGDDGTGTRRRRS